MNVLAVDIGGTHVKILASGQEEPRRFDSGPTLTPDAMVSAIKKLARGWKYDRVSIGYPGPVLHGRPVAEPHNLGKGWVGFDYQGAFGQPVKIMNDAAMQALGSYQGGKMLFLGLGTGLGSSLIVDGIVEPLEMGHLPYKKGTYEDYVGLRGLEKRGKKKWRKHVADVVERLVAALEPDDVVIGGGNAKKLKELPRGCRAGANVNAFQGGFRLWEEPSAAWPGPARTVHGSVETAPAAVIGRDRRDGRRSRNVGSPGPQENDRGALARAPERTGRHAARTRGQG